MISNPDSIPHDFGPLARNVLALAERSLRRYRIRRLMRELDPERLAQLGVCTDDDAADASKWFWQA